MMIFCPLVSQKIVEIIVLENENIFFFFIETVVLEFEGKIDLQSAVLQDNLGFRIDLADFNGIINQYLKSGSFFININTLNNKHEKKLKIITSDVSNSKKYQLSYIINQLLIITGRSKLFNR